MAGVSPQTLTRLLDGHTAALVLYARQWCSTPEDVVQDVFLLLMREPAAPQNPLGWLYRAVRNKAINAARSGRRRWRHEAIAARRGQPWLVAADADRLDAATAARALAELPIEQREVIVARLWGGLPLAEIAALTGSSVSTTHRWYQRGIAALRERLEGTCPEKKSNCRT
ncbi:MAG: RNA polymerase sigma factor [Thermoguttaceae bacterium]|jgi:RNA polymerase sigma-70 factor (ECF subfamily)